jgi:hypothetical protein
LACCIFNIVSNWTALPTVGYRRDPGISPATSKTSAVATLTQNLYPKFASALSNLLDVW